MTGLFRLAGSGREPLDPALPAEAFVRRVPNIVERRPRPGPRRARGVLERGAVIDKYRIEELLGLGGFAAVYRATHLLLKTEVALKLLRGDVLEREPAIAGQLLNEARYAARIDHPNVVRIFDVTHTDHITYIVMEFIRGESLSRKIETRGVLPAVEVVRIGLDVAAGLDAGLREGLIHRDIKPANILIAQSGTARIVDLGLANPAAAVEGAAPGARPAIIGTRGYMAPEQARNPGAIDFRADIYSLGVTLREAATGRRPGALDAGVALAAAAPPRSLAAVLDRMMSPQAADRHSSYAALMDDLRAAGADL